MIDTSKTMLYHIDNLNTQSERISFQMASGKAIDKGSDESITHSILINLEDKLRATESLKLQLTKSKSMNDTADDNIAETKEALESIKVDLLKALNDGMDRSDKLALAANLRGIRGNIYDRINESIDGEYLFAGSDTTKQTLVRDSNFENNGKITYGGDGFLRKIAVQPGSYRDRGVTAYDVTFYNASRATKGEDFTFAEGDRIIDEAGYEWKVIDASAGMTPRDPANPTTNTLYLQKYDFNGVAFDPSIYPETRIAIDTVTAEVEATTTAEAQRESYTILGTGAGMAAQPQGRVFEAKHNYFDDLNRIINALEGHITLLDGTKGAVIDDGMVRSVVSNGLEQTSFQYDATNIGHGELGGRNKIFEVNFEKLEAQTTHYNILIQEYGGADLAKLAMESKALELTYQSLYTSISKMHNLSLVNFIS